jgi:hypothetical protein
LANTPFERKRRLLHFGELDQAEASRIIVVRRELSPREG